MKDINLLPPKNVLSQQERKARQLLLIFTSLLVGSVMIAFGALLGFSFYLDNQLTNQQSINEDLKIQLQARQGDALKLRTIQYKLEGIDILLGSQLDFGERLQRAYELAPFPIQVESLDWTNGHKLIMVLTFPSRVEAESFLTKVGEEKEFPYFQNVKVGNLSQAAGGAFTLSMQADYKPSSTNSPEAQDEIILSPSN